MGNNFSLEQYLNNGVKNIMTGIAKASLKNPKAAFFMTRHALVSKKATERRDKAESEGRHIPPFLIASITHQCNLHCKGCYARANQSCVDGESETGIMTGKQWEDIFDQAQDMGIEFILLAGGEPFVRKDVLETAGKHRDIIFPIFTNGTLMDDSYIKLLDDSRNLMPVISIEGGKETTDGRRGSGVFEHVGKTMEKLKGMGILFGASVTVTKENIEQVLSDTFLRDLENRGVKAIVYVEYVPVDGQSRNITPDEKDRIYLMDRLTQLRTDETTGMVLIAFPGDEQASGGCLAAGRGFFHINAFGGAEPCPFSPYSDTSVLQTSLKEALQSPLFRKLQTAGNLAEEHLGGCTLFEQREQVEEFLREVSI